MNRALPFAVLALAACGPDFRGEKGLGFDSTLGHQYVPWTPAQPLARGTPVTITFVPEPCLVNCPPAVVYEAGLGVGDALRLTGAGPNRLSAVAQSVGESSVVFTRNGGIADRFLVSVADPIDLSLTDPLAFNQRVYPQFIGFDAGTWPDVGETVVMGPGGDLYLEVLVLDDAGHTLGYQPADLSVSATGGGWGAKTAGMEIDVHSPDAGTGTVTVAWGDAGVAHTFALRVAAPGEGTVAQLLVQQVNTVRYVFKADVRTDGGEALLEPELEWLPDPGFVEVDTMMAASLRPRRDVKVYDFRSNDAGVFDAGVTVRLGTSSASTVVFPVVEAAAPAMPAPPAPAPSGCGCTSVPLPLVLLAALMLRNKKSTPGF